MGRLTFNPCDECGYSYSKRSQESNTCKICEFKRMLDLDRQGLLLKLPCKAGDTVYTIDEDGSFIEESKVEEVSTHRVWIDSMYFDYDDFGKTVFLTKEESEASLKEMSE